MGSPVLPVLETGLPEALLRLMFGAENFTMDMEQATTESHNMMQQ